MLALSCLGASLLFTACTESTTLTSTELGAQATLSETDGTSTEETTSDGTDASTGEEAVCPDPWTPPAECEALRGDLAACHESAQIASEAARAQAEACHDGVRAQCEPLVAAVHTCLEA
ncbi:hypothetical protein L6R52_22385, partial [Myxococcota bacterium]|nr:hypothetical protein [Myxococcota bacterium]